jgi:hypothetical protein
MSREHLAHLLKDQGDPAAAQPLFKRALLISEKVFGPEHPTHETALGANHPWTKDSAVVTADALAALGRADEATALRRRRAFRGPR